MMYKKAYIDKLKRTYNYKTTDKGIVLDDRIGEIDIDCGLTVPREILFTEMDQEDSEDGEDY